jgi:hydroxylaminobenzene mutase
MHDASRRLYFHGVLLFLLSLVEGLFVYRMPNPRMGLTTHVGGLMSGLYVIGLGALWQELRLSARWLSATYWLTVVGMYGSTASLLLAALLNTRNSTPIAGAAAAAEPWREALVNVALSLTGVAALAAVAAAVWGLRGRKS